jgi:hypothetical protein
MVTIGGRWKGKKRNIMAPITIIEFFSNQDPYKCNDLNQQ